MEYLTLFISLRCTQSCAHCLYGCSPDKGESMSWNTFNRSLEIARENHIPALNFFGGEPLLNPQIKPMIQTAFENGLSLILATNCRPLANPEFFSDFVNLTEKFKDRILIVTARDHFHLQFFDPQDIISRLKSADYRIVVNSYADQSILLSEHNLLHSELQTLNTAFCCCKSGWADNVGVLPDGGWTICPPSLEPFGDIFSVSLPQLIEFKRSLPFQFEKGCTACLKDFPAFRQKFQEFVLKFSHTRSV